MSKILVEDCEFVVTVNPNRDHGYQKIKTSRNDNVWPNFGLNLDLETLPNLV